MATYVLRTHDIDQLVEFFTKMGMTFVPEKHGGGPHHFTCEVSGNVFEIYPHRPFEGEDETDLGIFYDESYQ